MARFFFLTVALVLASLLGAQGFTARRPMRMSSPAIAKPKVSIGQKSSIGQPQQKQVQKVNQKQRTQDGDTDEAPMYKVILIDDNTYTKEHVVKNLVRIISMEEKTAADVYVATKTDEQAIACITTQETAEHYVEQLGRCSPMIFANMEEE
eukprot:CAMPEP_0118851512 /NCGR_PEP_ID=MMETSP1163-20130328/936_1 /TAXON_ID=124430 /ORGANISM="Phaeomonas parva, Strain CCMP2877" /LENGTH=150 /DNA_ID=CAMNT_0006783867 /DNA_START=103 /DNA_END=555 /DNA_ORIENTATION=-